jgi:hypothetical protein
VWLSPATLIVLPPVLIAHWLEQIAFCTGGAADGPSVCVVGAGNGNEKAAAAPAAAGSGGGGEGWLFGVEGPDAADAEVGADVAGNWTEGGGAGSVRQGLPT